jgi:hypothetical protein
MTAVNGHGCGFPSDVGLVPWMRVHVGSGYGRGTGREKGMTQLTLEFAEEKAEAPAVCLAPEVEQEVVALMAQMITAITREPQGDSDEKRTDQQ